MPAARFALTPDATPQGRREPPHGGGSGGKPTPVTWAWETLSAEPARGKPYQERCLTAWLALLLQRWLTVQGFPPLRRLAWWGAVNVGTITN
ncbi:MAG: hypothetical protein KME57_17375 [Scytonema hyalinum WJT4-NPBG1]|jgi:hypothetical protein|nr:hypothetical protein [Scytonema hyalinum WJT4-NPBG1]